MPDGLFASPANTVVRTPHDLPSNTRLRIVRPKGSGEKVMALLAKADGEIFNDGGQPVKYRAGEHYIVDYPSGSRQVVRRDIFEKTYRKVRAGVFRKNTDIRYRAAIVREHLKIGTLEGVREAKPGDWVMIGVADEMWPVPADEAARKYKGVSAVGLTGVGTTIALVFLLLAFVAWIST
jgi:hypothetical protein